MRTTLRWSRAPTIPPRLPHLLCTPETGFTMEQAQAHFNAAMAEVQPASAPMSVFQQAQEEQQYNLFLLKQHRLAEGPIDGKGASEEAMAAIAAASLNFVVEQSGRRGGAAAGCHGGEQPQLRLLRVVAELSGNPMGR